VGVYLNHQTNATIKNCSFNNFGDGIYSYYGSFTAKDNTFENNAEGGIDARYENNLSIEGNHFTNNTTYGVYLNGINDCNMLSNVFSGNQWGIYLSNSTNISANYNSVRNGTYGFLTTNSAYTANNNDITDNIVNIRSTWNTADPVDPDITINYWGTTVCSEIESKLQGVGINLNYEPFLDSSSDNQIYCTQ